MLTEHYRYYMNEVFALARSFVIKSNQSIINNNKFLNLVGHNTPYDKKEWKYYKNINGEYFTGENQDVSSGNDVIMFINSLDTGGVIAFTKENLADSPLTKKVYKHNSVEYKTLVSKYPSQIQLINGIISPVEKEKAIAASDWEILSYDSSFVESNEKNLIPNIQEWLYKFSARWYNRYYILTDSLYSATFHAIVYAQLPSLIINFRLNNCKTNQVHSWHVWQYLSSHYNFGKFKGVITPDQAAFLYHNIDWLTTHKGTSEVLDYLYVNFIKGSGLDLYSYVLRKDNENIVSQATLPKILLSDVKYNRYRYGEPNLIEDSSSSTPVNTVVNKMIPLATLNHTRVDRDIEDTFDKMRRMPYTEIPTGILECLPEFQTGFSLNKRIESLKYWLYISSLGLFKKQFILSIPGGISGLTLTSNDAITILLYCLNVYGKINDDLINPIYLEGVLNVPEDAETVMRNITDKTSVSDGRTYDLVADALDDLISYTEIKNDSDFVNIVSKLSVRKMRHLLLLGLVNSSSLRAQLNRVVGVLYPVVSCGFVSDLNYTNFFNRIGVDRNSINQGNVGYIVNSVISSYLNNDVVSSPTPKYKAMEEILTTLSSYTLKYVSSLEKNDSSSLPSNAYKSVEYNNMAIVLNFCKTDFLNNVKVNSKTIREPQKLIVLNTSQTIETSVKTAVLLSNVTDTNFKSLIKFSFYTHKNQKSIITINRKE